MQANWYKNEGKGHWNKVLKRFYGEFLACNSTFLEDRALQDLISFPDLDERIFQYFAARNRVKSLIGLFKAYVQSKECMFEGTVARFFDACVSIRHLSSVDEVLLRQIAKEYLLDNLEFVCKRPGGQVSAILLLYWTDYLQAILMWNSNRLRELPPDIVRAWLACSVVCNPDKLMSSISRAAANGSAPVARLAVFLTGLRDGSMDVNYPFANFRTNFPYGTGKYFDARAWLTLELIAALSPQRNNAASKALKNFQKYGSALPEKRILNRVEDYLAKSQQ